MGTITQRVRIPNVARHADGKFNADDSFLVEVTLRPRMWWTVPGGIDEDTRRAGANHTFGGKNYV